MEEENRIACISLRKSSYRYRPPLHLIEVNYRDIPIGKTFCGRVVNRMKYYCVYDGDKEPTCKKCIQKQKRTQS